jgi:hypothetical protein
VSRRGDTTARTDGCVELPRHVLHGFRDATALPARVLVALSPGIQALDMFRDLDSAGRAATFTPQEIGTIAVRFGVRFV